jgi:hypothetical protein
MMLVTCNEALLQMNWKKAIVAIYEIQRREKQQAGARLETY